MAKTDGFAGVKIPRSPVYGTRGMVVSGHSLASLAGLRTLERGGSMADATIACSAALSVVVPHATSLGGDAFILYHRAGDGRTLGLNASGHAPRGATLDLYAGGIPLRGPLAFSVPGMIRGWERMHERHGKLPWADLFADAAALAEAHPLSRVLAGALRLFRQDIEGDAGCRDVYYPDGEPLPAGAIVRQPALARTLGLIAEHGSSVFYEGEIAESIAASARAQGGVATAADFAGYEPEWVEPLESGYRGLAIRVMPPNSYGVLMLMQLNALDGVDPAELSGEEGGRLACLMRAQRAAFAAGQKYIADPRTDPAPVDRLLSDETTAALRAEVLGAAEPALAAAHPAGGTSCITIADGEGNGISVVQSVFHVFGSAFLDPGTGILMNNRMTGFSIDPDSANALAPGKRPAHTLNPVVVLDGGKLRYLMTTPGGPSQTLSHVQILNNMVDRGMELTAAIEAPRWSINMQGETLLDEAFDDNIADRLADAGFPVKRAAGAAYFGSAKMIEVAEDGVLMGAADTRREAYAVGA
ncbi:MAG: gamma-glutamyltransferase family protein [Defluviicoccus sp.]|nr:gamma-glutamyltransferase family protein [Defluviicoccus sp.]MDE0277087.1 gamma-glutamyltransferase family protein [Defluviicoccus sp.]